MSWLVYWILSIGLTAVVASLVVCRAMLRRGGRDAGLLSSAAAPLSHVRVRFGKAWGWRGELPVVARCGRERRERDKSQPWVQYRALRPTSGRDVVLRTRAGWRTRLNDLSASEPDERLFDELFELRGRHATSLAGWPSARARKAVLALLSSEALAGGDSPYRRGRHTSARPAVTQLALFCANDGVGVRWLGATADGAALEQVLLALEQLVDLPLEAQKPVALTIRGGGWGLLLGSLFWAVTLLTVIGHQCALLDGVSGQIVERDSSWLGAESRLIVATDQGLRPIWVPSDAYQQCASGPLVREPLSATVHCGGQARLHLMMLGQIPMILLMWLGVSMGAAILAADRYERRHRRATPPARAGA